MCARVCVHVFVCVVYCVCFVCVCVYVFACVVHCVYCMYECVCMRVCAYICMCCVLCVYVYVHVFVSVVYCVCYVCVCAPSEYYLLVVGDGQRILAAKVLSQVWSSFVDSRVPSDGITWHLPLLCPCEGVVSLSE